MGSFEAAGAQEMVMSDEHKEIGMGYMPPACIADNQMKELKGEPYMCVSMPDAIAEDGKKEDRQAMEV